MLVMEATGVSEASGSVEGGSRPARFPGDAESLWVPKTEFPAPTGTQTWSCAQSRSYRDPSPDLRPAGASLHRQPTEGSADESSSRIRPVVGGTSNPAPGRTLDQRMRALRHANEIRSGRARLKKELALGRVRLEEIIAQPPESAKTAKVYDLLLALPMIGPARATRCLTQCRIAPSKTVGGLSERQRHELIGLFRR